MLGLLGKGAQPSSLWENIVAFDTVISLALALIAVGAWLRTRWKLRSVTQTQLRMSDELGALRINLTEAERENEELAKERDDWMPRKWIDAAEKERASGNDAVAIDILDQGFQRVRGELGLVTHQLAEFHTSRMLGFDANRELEAARRLSGIARGLAPNGQDIVALANDLQDIEIHDGEPLQIASSRFDAANPVEAERVILAALTASRSLFAEGRYRTCAVILERAVRLSRRHNLENRDLGLRVIHRLAEAYSFAGRYKEALAIGEDLIPRREGQQGPEHSGTLATRFLVAQALSKLGQYERALAALKELLPIYEKVLGAEHPNTLTNRLLESDILSKLDRNDEALLAIRTLLPLSSRVKGKEHPEVLVCRSLEAKILSKMGKSEEALSILRKVLPIFAQVQGKDHPIFIADRALEASILFDLERYAEALRVLRGVLPARMQALGSDHPAVLGDQHLEAHILARLDQLDDARQVVTSLLSRQEQSLGRDHPAVLLTLALRAEILLSLGNFEDSLEEIEKTHLLQVRQLGIGHTQSLVSELVRLKILAAMGRQSEVASEIDRVYDALLAATGPDHFRVKEAWELKDQ